MNAPLYTTEILRLAASLEEMVALEREDGRAEVQSPTCGSRITVAVELDDVGRVRRLSQQVHACAFGQASAALMQKHAPGRSRDEVSSAVEAIARWLGEEQVEGGWPGVEALAAARAKKGRHAAILLPYRALLAAMGSAK